jgi:hypothetical protein
MEGSSNGRTQKFPFPLIPWYLLKRNKIAMVQGRDTSCKQLVVGSNPTSDNLAVAQW